uniref:Cytochrome c oxidase subunit 2 n=1 Tax=Sinochlora szechwanensis TaxID=948359 RepID=A0A1X9IRR3_9ORTH|nr:cytochrome c oxidase subunit II [Sinochlora szechwanensis]APL97159.1 cytochrome c oxidase subunit 2 [Sinochlora szechwanensis]
MPTWSNLNLQNSASPMMEQLTFFHDHALMILLMITVLVAYIMASLFYNPFINRFLLQGQTIEIIWTIFPAITLFFIALPSLRLLYMLDESLDPIITVKTIGHQWYWSYEYSDLVTPYEFDTYMIPSNEMNNNSFRLLDVDNRTVLPMLVQIRMLITAADVLHSWTVPALGVKADATPGRLNQTSFLMNRPGIYYGQCSEICGANHSFMPIVIESVNTKTFIKWLYHNMNS